ncbi:hypothetical protein RWX45_12000, partial [Actinomyces sp. MRS3W]|nr:hypothetical protein [Actinomyces sp. MRS3W]
MDADITAPLTPGVRVLLAGSFPTGAQAARAGARPAGAQTAHPDVLAEEILPDFPHDVARTCTGAAPVLCPRNADADDAAHALLAEPDVSAVVLLMGRDREAGRSAHTPTASAARTITDPADSRVIYGSLEDCCRPDGADRLVALL